jgi:hypothetical protein
MKRSADSGNKRETKAIAGAWYCAANPVSTVTFSDDAFNCKVKGSSLSPDTFNDLLELPG